MRDFDLHSAISEARAAPRVTALRNRLLRNVSISERGCWEWVGHRSTAGYGQIGVGSSTDNTRRLMAAHRVSYEQFVAEIPSGLELDHLCRVRHCVNPAHLEPVTHSENVKRGLAPKYWSAKTHCPHGHAYSEDNTYIYRGRRNCKACISARSRARCKVRLAVSQ